MHLSVAGARFSSHLFDEIEFQTGQAEFLLPTFQYDETQGRVTFSIERRPFKELKRFLGILEHANYESERVRTSIEIGHVTGVEFLRADWATEKDDRFYIERGIALRPDHVWVDSLQEDAGRKAFRLIVKISAIDICLDDATEPGQAET